MVYAKVVVLSPPFYSHFNPLLSLARAFKRSGADVLVACSEAFELHIRTAGLRFSPLDINRNSNTGVAQQTDQAQSEAERLAAFFRATRGGPIATLTLQSRHRRLDMLTDPGRLREEIAQLADQERPDLFVVDQLSYAVSLALYCLSLPFITFCSGHPTYIPRGDQVFGVPYAWPREFRIPLQELQKLREVATQTDRQFTEIFNAIIQDYDSRLLPIPIAFRFTSSQAILFNYPDFSHLHQEENGVKKVFMGYAFEPEPLPPEWKARLAQADCDGPRVLITLGSFLSAREDVLDRCLRAVKRAYPYSTVIVSAGANVDKLANWQSESVIVEKFVPQKGLLPHVDLVIHHGGCNSFTEALYYGKPMLILPFSSDQFSIGYDAQKEELAECLDPNHFDDEELAEKMALMLRKERGEPLARWQQHVTERGPDYAIRQIQRAKDAK
jgi:UDP:flavonoid glycosyltransferase YjiC (YdhE family)